MHAHHTLITAFITLLLCVPACAQEQDLTMLAPESYNALTEPDIDLFINSWKESTPQMLFGTVLERQMLSPLGGDDPISPTRRGAACTSVSQVSYALLPMGIATPETVLEGEQAILYVIDGVGTIETADGAFGLRKDSCVLIPEGLAFVLSADTGASLKMYAVIEPTPEDFTPRRDILLIDYATEPIQGTTGHWVNQNKRAIDSDDGLATITGYAPIWLDPLTMAQPHSHGPGVEEIWIAVEGDIVLFMGKELRDLPPGTAYKVPPDGKTPHANINQGDTPIQLIWFMEHVPGSPLGKHAALDPNPFDPATDPAIDLFIADWHMNESYERFGSLTVRNLFSPLAGNDPIRPERKGEVLTHFSTVAHAVLYTHEITVPSALDGEQLVFFTDTGAGVIETSSQRFELKPQIGLLLPPDIEFTITNTGDVPLTFWLIGEEVPDDFKPNREILFKDPTLEPILNANGHWCHIFSPLFWKADGFHSILGMGPVQYAPMTIGQPHSHPPGIEEIWFILRGDFTMMLGKELRELGPGGAFKVPPTGKTPHANINLGDEPIMLFWIYKE